MKTTTTLIAILATALFSQTAMAKLGENRSTLRLDSDVHLTIEAEIVENISNMLANVQAPTIKTDVAKQLNIGTVQSQTNELVQNATENLPGFKFKVVIAD